MISPTGKPIRNDSAGLGHYGAKRSGNRLHHGTDYLAIAGQPIVAPFDMVLSRYSNPSSKFPLESGVKWVTPSGSGKMFYFVPIPKLIGTFVSKAEVIGIAIDLATYYGSDVSSHIHFQIDSFDPEMFRRLAEIMTDYRMFSNVELP
ncbi:MAG: hypothetical protein GY845_03180 [Planctomycetes bacterium]|nr:hypothetical protein [Planctomycetota bacterium]